MVLAQTITAWTSTSPISVVNVQPGNSVRFGDEEERGKSFACLIGPDRHRIGEHSLESAEKSRNLLVMINTFQLKKRERMRLKTEKRTTRRGRFRFGEYIIINFESTVLIQKRKILRCHSSPRDTTEMPRLLVTLLCHGLLH